MNDSLDDNNYIYVIDDHFSYYSPAHGSKHVLSVQVQKASCSTVAERKGTISQYFTTLHCPVCDELTQLGVCISCRGEPQRVAITLYQDMRLWESQQDQLLQVSGRGTGHHWEATTGCRYVKAHSSFSKKIE